jgi:hypothetical protein
MDISVPGPFSLDAHSLHQALARLDEAARMPLTLFYFEEFSYREIAASGLEPGQEYQLELVDSLSAPYGNRQRLVSFKANASGSAIAQTIGPIRSVLTHGADAAPELRRYLIVSKTGKTQSAGAILVQKPVL